MDNSQDPDLEAFAEFTRNTEPRLRRALTAALGRESGREATSDALVHGWRNWDRVRAMDNPIGFLYRVGINARPRPKPSVIQADIEAVNDHVPWFEPGLAPAIASLPDRQRVVVVLLHAFDWTMSEVAEVLRISKGSVQVHERRAMRSLRAALGVAK